MVANVAKSFGVGQKRKRQASGCVRVVQLT